MEGLGIRWLSPHQELTARNGSRLRLELYVSNLPAILVMTDCYQCFVKADQPVHITLHYPTGSQTPDAVNVKAEGTPRDGSCPALTQSSRTPTTYQIHSKTPVKIQG